MQKKIKYQIERNIPKGRFEYYELPLKLQIKDLIDDLINQIPVEELEAHFDIRKEEKIKGYISISARLII